MDYKLVLGRNKQPLNWQGRLKVEYLSVIRSSIKIFNPFFMNSIFLFLGDLNEIST